MRLNLGCGDRYVEGWTNVDWQSPHRLDERVDLTGRLPWHWACAATHVYAGHLFEHLAETDCEQLTQRLLEAAHPSGCVFVVVGPDVKLAEQMAAEGRLNTGHTLEEIRHGGGRWPGDKHQWETTGSAVATIIAEAGWPVVHQIRPFSALEPGWPVADPVPQWQYAVRAWIGEP